MELRGVPNCAFPNFHLVLFISVREGQKNSELKKEIYLFIFSYTSPTFAVEHKVYNSYFSNQYFAQIIFPCTLWNDVSVPEVSKL